MKPLVLIILDGFGLNPDLEGNAISQAHKPNFDALLAKYPNTHLIASGVKVGLPQNQRGNSEAGHMNLGAGRIVEQDVVGISESISDGTFFKNPALNAAFRHVTKNNSQLHLVGMISGSQSPHVEMEHVYALLKFFHKKCEEEKKCLDKIFLHLFTDGRDAPTHKALKFLHRLEKHFEMNERIATIGGRFFGMDRNKRWERVGLMYKAMVLGQSAVADAENAEEAILQAYDRGESDEFISPTVIKSNGQPIATVKDNDAMVFFNLRSDRTRELSKAFVQPEFNALNPGSFQREVWPKNLLFVAMTDFGPDLDSILTAFPSKDVPNSLPMVLKDLRQLYIAETEKYAHVTFFFNGGYAQPIAGEERISILSPNVRSYDEIPEMSAKAITAEVVKRLTGERDDFICLNFANPDMVGHTGNFKAAIKAIEVVDDCLGQIVKAAQAKHGTVIITADHGNADQMENETTKELDTEHSAFPVPFILVNDDLAQIQLHSGILADVAPTILDILGLPQPEVMTGKSLIIRKK
ncbi:MAG: 2,3-bisphosphoglycerate-independent phosphoglycerate mutase [Candidatus Komeilibacteria bacterium]|nr:2,3-bisphosphoglycerate-independent phosphoglycerate mutase [Candidatus Komeilibacteria bacterium]